MSSALKDIFQQQKDHTQDSELEQHRLETTTVLCFKIRDMNFVCNLKEIKEILEVSDITPYPVSVKGHIGLINLRGKVIPIVCPFCEDPHELTDFSKEAFRKLNEKRYRIVVFDNEGEHYGMMAGQITKKEIEQEVFSSQSVINIGETPYRVLNPMDFNAGEKSA